MLWNADRPMQPAFAQALTEWRAQPITSIGKDAAEADASGTNAVENANERLDTVLGVPKGFGFS